MKKSIKQILATFLVVLLLLSSAPLTEHNALFAQKVNAASEISLNRPLDRDYTITAREYYPSGSYHGAIDYGCPKGTPVYAAENGKITVYDGGYGDGYSGSTAGSGWGNYADISHSNGYKTRYAHMSAGRFVVHSGDNVVRGQLIGYSGNSGNSTGPHLHFGLYLYGNKVYPESYITTASGYKDSAEPPTKAEIWTDKSSYAKNEDVTFHFNTDGTTNTLWLYLPDGSSRYYQDLDSSYVLAFGWEGHYQALVQTWNSVGNKTSKRIDFVIGPPTFANISIAKNIYAINEKVVFNFDSDGSTNTSWIYYPDGSRKYYSDVNSSYSLTFKEEGQYQALVQTWNRVGEKTSEKISFQVINTSHTHSYIEEITKQPTCTTTGVKTFKCSTCDNSYTESVAALGHDYATTFTIDTSATCTTDGSKSKHCSRCDAKTEVTVIKATGHINTYGTKGAGATCTEDGITPGTVCKDCGTVISGQEVIKATGHKEVVYAEMIPPTCTADGHTAETRCINCGIVMTKSKVIPATAHTDNNHDDICDECGTDISIDNPSANCSCNCHKSGISGFFFQIKLFFWKLFRIESNRYCSCGKAHW